MFHGILLFLASMCEHIQVMVGTAQLLKSQRRVVAGPSKQVSNEGVSK